MQPLGCFVVSVLLLVERSVAGEIYVMPLLFHQHDSLHATECTFEYTQQPPSTTIDNCNPYMGPMDNIIIRTSLECRVRRQTGVTDRFNIKWFRENTTGAVEDLGTGSPTLRTSDGRQLVSR